MFPEQQISILDMISESCDNEDWRNSALITGINYILKYIQIENSYFKMQNISQYYCFFIIITNIIKNVF